MEQQVNDGAETREAMISKALARYEVSDAAIAEMRAKFSGLQIAGLDDKDGFKRVHEAEQVCVRTRSAIEKTRKALKEDALRFGQAVDGEATRLKLEIEGIEAPLTAQKQAVLNERARIAEASRLKAEAERKARLDARMAKLSAVRAFESPSVVESWTEAAFDVRLAEAMQIEVERQARETREAAERAQREAAESEARKAQEAALAQERAALEAQRKVQAEAESKLAAERAKVEAEARRLAEQEAAAKRAQEIEAAKAQAAKEALAREEARRKADAEADAKRAAALPEVERVRAFAAGIVKLQIPETEMRDVIVRILSDAASQIVALTNGIGR